MAGRKPTVSDKEVLRQIALMPDPVITAPELGERLDMTRQGANNRLTKLEDQEYVKSKKVGAHAIVYWLTEKGREAAGEG